MDRATGRPHADRLARSGPQYPIPSTRFRDAVRPSYQVDAMAAEARDVLLEMINHGNIAMASPLDLATLTVKDFEPHLNDVFEMGVPAGTLPLKLAKTECYGQAIREGGAFSLFFVAPAGPFLPQAIYPVRHPALGTMEIFLVPVGAMPGGNGYQAVFT